MKLFILVLALSLVVFGEHFDEESCVKYAGGTVYPHSDTIDARQHNLQFTKAVSKYLTSGIKY